MVFGLITEGNDSSSMKYDYFQVSLSFSQPGI